MTAEQLTKLRERADRDDRLYLDDIFALFDEIDSLRRHNQTLADELNDWRDKCQEKVEAMRGACVAQLRLAMSLAEAGTVNGISAYERTTALGAKDALLRAIRRIESLILGEESR